MAKLVQYLYDKRAGEPGTWKGKIKINKDFDKLPAEFIKHFK